MNEELISKLQDPENLRLHMGELTEDQLLVAQSAVRFALSQLPPPEPEFKVSIGTMVESHQTTYMVCLTRSDRPADLSPLDSTGRITPCQRHDLEEAEFEAMEWARFLNVEFEPTIKDTPLYRFQQNKKNATKKSRP